jgi:tetratricopeptide (TPR) repeat protein
VRAGLDRGGEDYRARMLLASLLQRRNKGPEAVEHLRAAERAFPGYPDAQFSAELELARHLERAEDETGAMEARLRWLAWNAGDYVEHVKVAEWLVRGGRHAEAEKLWREASEVDPFRRHLHYSWGLTLRALGRHAEALREFDLGLAVAKELDGDVLRGASEGLSLEQLLALVELTREEWEALAPEERRTRVETAMAERASQGGGAQNPSEARFRDQEPLLHGLAALSLLELGRKDEARARVEAALALDPGCAPALEARARL